jgi:predicted transcriptional regulator
MAAMQGTAGLTRLELELMQVIWRRGASTVGEVQAGLAEPVESGEAPADQAGGGPREERAGDAPGGRQLAYTTVQTVLNTLHRKGKLTRQTQGRAFVYSAAITEAKALRHAVRDLVDRMFGGSSEELVMSLVKSREVDMDRLKAMTEKLEAEELDGK